MRHRRYGLARDGGDSLGKPPQQPHDFIEPVTLAGPCQAWRNNRKRVRTAADWARWR